MVMLAFVIIYICCRKRCRSSKKKADSVESGEPGDVEMEGLLKLPTGDFRVKVFSKVEGSTLDLVARTDQPRGGLQES